MRITKKNLVSRLMRMEEWAETVSRREEREQKLAEFSRDAEEYLREARRYLGEPAESEVSISCRNEAEKKQVAGKMLTYYLLVLRQRAREEAASASPTKTTLTDSEL